MKNAVPAVIAAAIGFFLPLAVPSLGQLELRIFDHYSLAYLRTEANQEIITVGIATDTLRKLGATLRPELRAHHAKLLRLLNEAGAAVVVFDLYFDLPTDPEVDRQLAAAIRESRITKVVLAKQSALQSQDESALSGRRHYFGDVILPVSDNPNVEFGMVVAFAPDETARGIYTILNDWSQGENRPCPHVVLSAYALSRGGRSSDYGISTRNRTLSLGSTSWGLGVDGELETRFAKEGQGFDAFEYEDALRMLADPSQRKLFARRIVLVGDASGDDVVKTPVGSLDGIEFLAQSLSGMIASANSPLRRLHDAWVFIFCVSCALLTSYAFRPARMLRTSLLLLAAVLAVVLVPRFTFAVGHVWLPTVSAALSVGITAVGVAALQALRSDRFIPLFARRGRRADAPEEAVVLFTDIVGSTTLLEQLGDDRGRTLFSRVLVTLGEVVTKHGGEVERTLGDGLLAIYRKCDSDRYVQHAIDSVNSMREAIAELNQDRFEGFPPLDLTFGLEEGVIAGRRTQAQGREEWGSFGRTIHLAARLQAECKNQNTQILIGPRLAELAGKTVPLLKMRPFEARGFSGTVQPYAPDPSSTHSVSRIHKADSIEGL